jgi:hypothetical protein
MGCSARKEEEEEDMTVSTTEHTQHLQFPFLFSNRYAQGRSE